MVRDGLETLSYLGPKIWSTIPDELKSLTTVKSFKKSIRKWKLTKCPCNHVRSTYQVLVMWYQMSDIFLI